MKKFLKYILVFGFLILFIKYSFLILLIWGIIELLIFSLYHKSTTKIKQFICNFVLTILNCIDILFNVILQIPANRILLTTHSPTLFGNPQQSFTEVLRSNFIYNNLKYRGVLLYKFIIYFKKILA